VLREIPGALAAELRALEWRGRRGLEAAEAAASVTLAVLAALALHSDEPWWSAITAFMVTRAAPMEAVLRGIMRVAGSIVGALVALVALRLFVYQSLPFLLCLFLSSVVGLVGFATSRYGYAWLVGAITACLVMLMSFDQPQSAFDTAVNRVVDVMIGTAAFARSVRSRPAAARRRRACSSRRPWLSGDAATAPRCSAGCLETEHCCCTPAAAVSRSCCCRHWPSGSRQSAQ
jgi:uncharacterized membrane protein YccC